MTAFACLPDDDDRAVLDRKSGSEQFWYLLHELRWQRDRCDADHVADIDCRCGRARDGRGLDEVPDQPNFFRCQIERSLIGSRVGSDPVLFNAGFDLGFLC